MPPRTLHPRLKLLLVSCSVAAVLLPALSRVAHLLRRRRSKTIRGPPSPSFLLGYTRVLHEAEVDGRAAELFAQWANQYGNVYWLPHPLGASHLVVSDPKAVAHIFAHDTTMYMQTELQRTVVKMLTGTNLMSFEGSDHRRHRRTMVPSFSNTALRDLKPLLEEQAQQLRRAWQGIIGTQERVVIDIEEWMNRISLDNIGSTGFSHSFNATLGSNSRIYTLFNTFNGEHSLGSLLVFLFASTLPALWKLPTRFRRLANDFERASRELAEGLLTRTREEADPNIRHGESPTSSVLEALIHTRKLQTPETTQAQIQLLLLAAFDTTSTVLTWALILLAQHPDVQQQLREQLADLPVGSKSSYLDAVVHETLRLHPPLPELTRVAAEDDIISLSEPIVTSDGSMTDRVHVSRGTVILLPVEYINQSALVWGSDARDFRPERWLKDSSAVTIAGKTLGYRGMLTFSDGPRICLGKSFAIAEMQEVLRTLVQHFSFELVGGAHTEIGRHRAMVSRPTLMGEREVKMPMIVRSID